MSNELLGDLVFIGIVFGLILLWVLLSWYERKLTKELIKNLEIDDLVDPATNDLVEVLEDKGEIIFQERSSIFHQGLLFFLAVFFLLLPNAVYFLLTDAVFSWDMQVEFVNIFLFALGGFIYHIISRK